MAPAVTVAHGLSLAHKRQHIMASCWHTQPQPPRIRTRPLTDWEGTHVPLPRRVLLFKRPHRACRSNSTHGANSVLSHHPLKARHNRQGGKHQRPPVVVGKLLRVNHSSLKPAQQGARQQCSVQQADPVADDVRLAPCMQGGGTMGGSVEAGSQGPAACRQACWLRRCREMHAAAKPAAPATRARCVQRPLSSGNVAATLPLRMRAAHL